MDKFSGGEPLTLVVWTLVSQHFFLLVFIILVGVALKRRYITPLRFYPDPFLASFTSIWKIIDVASTRTNLNSIELHKRYGPFVRIGPNEISMSDPAFVGEVLAPGKGFSKTDFYSVFPPQEPKDIFTELDEYVHANKKRVAAIPYSMNTMLQISEPLTNTIQHLVLKLKSAAVDQGHVDLGQWLHFFAFDSLGEVAFSSEFGFLNAGRDIDHTLYTIKQAARYGGIVGQKPLLDRLLLNNPILKALPFRRKDLLVAAKALEEVQKREPFSELKEPNRKDILSYLISGHLRSPSTFKSEDVSAVAIGAM